MHLAIQMVAKFGEDIVGMTGTSPVTPLRWTQQPWCQRYLSSLALQNMLHWRKQRDKSEAGLMSKAMRDDEEQLIARSQRGDVHAFNQLVLHYQQTLYGVVFRMLGDPDTAADVTQDAFIAAFKGIGSYRGGSSFRAWLLRVGSNMACDYWRRTQRRPAESLEALTEDDEAHAPSVLNALATTGLEGNPEETLLSQELQNLIQRGLEELPLEQRVAVVLCDIEGLSYEEVAATTQASLGTVRSRISRGRARLRSYLQEHKELLPRHYRLSKE